MILGGLFWTFSQVAKTVIYSHMFSSPSYCWFWRRWRKESMICLNHIPTLHLWGFPSHLNSLNTLAHLPTHHFFPKMMTSTKTKHDSCSRLKHTLSCMSHLFSHSSQLTACTAFWFWNILSLYYLLSLFLYFSTSLMPLPYETMTCCDTECLWTCSGSQPTVAGVQTFQSPVFP